MARWNRPGVPHKGWTEIACIDIKEDVYGEEDFEYETCEMCNNERIRYIHLLKHPDYEGEIRVGCDCACKMTEDYETAPEAERRIRNRAARRKNFLRQEWYQNRKGNWVLKYKGCYVTALKRNGSYGCVCNDVWIWAYKGQKIYDLETLKMAAFDIFDEE